MNNTVFINVCTMTGEAKAYFDLLESRKKMLHYFYIFRCTEKNFTEIIEKHIPEYF